MKIAVYAIALNEEKFARRFMETCQGADLVLVADTGSSDDTAPLLTSLGAKVRSIRIDPWRFDAARNAALDLLPADVDICVSVDLDQILPSDWRAMIEAAWNTGADQIAYTNVYIQAGPQGSEATFIDNRIHARAGFTWRYPCHECLLPAPARSLKLVELPQLRMLHAPDVSKPRSSYVPLLELGVSEAPDDPRAAHYLGREYYIVGRYAEAALEFHRHLRLTPGESNLERNASLRYLARCREELGDTAGALAEFRAAVEDRPWSRGAWVDLAWAHYRRQDWTACLAAAEQAVAIPTDLSPIYGDDTSPGVVPEDLACLASWSLGRPRQALGYANAALARAPGQARLQANVRRIETALARKGPQAFGVSQTPLDDELRTSEPAPPSRAAGS